MAGCSPTIRRTEISPWVWPISSLNAVPRQASVGTILRIARLRVRSESNEETDLEESIFAFSKAPEEQIGRVSKGGSTGAKVRLERPQNGNKGRVLISLGQKEASFDVAENLGRDVAIADTPFTLKIDDYWADFRIENGNPTSVTDQPNNPAVLVTIRGKGCSRQRTRNKSTWKCQRSHYNRRPAINARTW